MSKAGCGCDENSPCYEHLAAGEWRPKCTCPEDGLDTTCPFHTRLSRRAIDELTRENREAYARGLAAGEQRERERWEAACDECERGTPSYQPEAKAAYVTLKAIVLGRAALREIIVPKSDTPPAPQPSTATFPALPTDPEADRKIDATLAKARKQPQPAPAERAAADELTRENRDSYAPAALTDEQIAEMVEDCDGYSDRCGLVAHVRALAAEVRRLRGIK